jgi:hypothetical protein
MPLPVTAAGDFFTTHSVSLPRPECRGAVVRQDGGWAYCSAGVQLLSEWQPYIHTSATHFWVTTLTVQSSVRADTGIRHKLPNATVGIQLGVALAAACPKAMKPCNPYTPYTPQKQRSYGALHTARYIIATSANTTAQIDCTIGALLQPISCCIRATGEARSRSGQC